LADFDILIFMHRSGPSFRDEPENLIFNKPFITKELSGEVTMAEDISNMIYRLVLRQSLHEIINDCNQLKEIKEILKNENIPIYYVGLDEDLDIIRFKCHTISEKIDYENPIEWEEEVNTIKGEWEELWRAIAEKTDIKNIVVEAEKISKEKKKETGKKDRKLEQAIEILKLHQPLD